MATETDTEDETDGPNPVADLTIIDEEDLEGDEFLSKY